MLLLPRDAPSSASAALGCWFERYLSARQPVGWMVSTELLHLAIGRPTPRPRTARPASILKRCLEVLRRRRSPAASRSRSCRAARALLALPRHSGFASWVVNNGSRSIPSTLYLWQHRILSTLKSHSSSWSVRVAQSHRDQSTVVCRMDMNVYSLYSTVNKSLNDVDVDETESLQIVTVRYLKLLPRATSTRSCL